MDIGMAAHMAAEKHLAACYEAEEVWEEAVAEGADVSAFETPASAPFDGCTTCEVREVLHAAWPILIDGIAGRLREAGHTDAAELVATFLE